MQKTDNDKSIVLIGPKGVGKTLISSEIEKSANLSCLSSDLLTNFIAARLSGLSTDKIDFPLSSKLKLEELYPYVYQMAKIKQNESISEKVQKMGLQYWKIRLLEEALSQIDYPIVLDLGADIGAVYNLTEQEKNQIKDEFFLDYNFIASRQEDFLKRFNNVIFIKPSEEYFKSKNDRINNHENKLYLENKNSYKIFASHEISSGRIFKSKRYSLSEKEIDASKATHPETIINKNGLQEVVSEIANLSQNEQGRQP